MSDEDSAWLRGHSDFYSPEAQEAFCERVAILIHEAGMNETAARYLALEGLKRERARGE